MEKETRAAIFLFVLTMVNYGLVRAIVRWIRNARFGRRGRGR